jgi:mannose-6-phosphate isomerase
MWHILAAEPARKSPRDSASRLRNSVAGIGALGEIEELLEWFDARPGDTFFIPAGTVHAIGAG